MTKKQKIIAILISVGTAILLVPIVLEIALFATFGFGHGIFYLLSLYWQSKSRPNYSFFAPSVYQLEVDDRDFLIADSVHLKTSTFKFVAESDKEEQTVAFQKGDGDDHYYLNISFGMFSDTSEEVHYYASFSKCTIGTNGRYTNLHAYYIDSTISTTVDEKTTESIIKIQLEPLENNEINASLYCGTQYYSKTLLPGGEDA